VAVACNGNRFANRVKLAQMMEARSRNRVDLFSESKGIIQDNRYIEAGSGNRVDY